jgi:nucleotide-binding universal stress UspA family protein
MMLGCSAKLWRNGKMEVFMNHPNAASSVREPHLETMRVHFDHLLVAVDLSPSSANTIKTAAELANRSGATLVVVHVLNPALMLPTETRANVKETLNAWMEPCMKKETRFAVEVAEGNVVEEVSRLARKHRADLLVIGTHAAGGAAKFVFGSTGEALFREMGIPVLTIGPHIHACGERFSSILLPTDLEPHSLRAAQYAVALAEESNGNLTLLHIPEKGEEKDAFGNRQRMEQLVPEDATLWCKPSFKIASGDPVDTILESAREVKADLIVLGVTHSRPLSEHASWSIASKVVRHAECPVLTVRDRL